MRRPIAPAIRLLALRLLAHEEVADSDPEGPWAGVDAVISKLSTQLDPLIGPTGFQILFARALHLARLEFPRLDSVERGTETSTGLPGLRESLRGLEPAEASEASGAIIARLLELLANFIGEDLTVRLVSRAWPDLPSGNADSASDREVV